MTYVTGFFLVFAGMLIGYFLWYRDRSEEDRVRVGLGKENDDLRLALENLQNNKTLLEERFDRQAGQLKVLQQLCDDWTTTQEQSEEYRVEMERESEDNRQKFETVSAEFRTLQQQHMELEDRFHAISQTNLTDQNHAELEWQQKLGALESLLNQRDEELASAANQMETLSQSLHRAQAGNAELESQIETNQRMLVTATRNAGGLKQEYVTLETSLKKTNDLLKKSHSETAAALSEKRLAQQSLAALKKAHQQLQAEANQLNAKLSKSSTREQEIASLNQSLESNRQQLGKVARQRDLALEAEQRSVAIVAGLQARIDNQESTIHTLREQYKGTLESAQAELKIRAKSDLDFADQRGQMERQIADLQQRLSDKSAEAESHDRLAHELDSELTELRSRYKTLLRQRTELNSQAVNQAQPDVQLESVQTQHALEIKSLQAKLKSSEETIRSLRRERAGVLARLANYRTIAEPDATVISFKQAMEQRKRQSYCEEYGGHVEKHPVRGVIYTSPPDRMDDLKQISGIAEVLEARLNDYGIYTFKQIMDWRPAAIEEFSRLLVFRDRIQRDDWQGQARILYEQDHRQAAAA